MAASSIPQTALTKAMQDRMHLRDFPLTRQPLLWVIDRCCCCSLKTLAGGETMPLKLPFGRSEVSDRLATLYSYLIYDYLLHGGADGGNLRVAYATTWLNEPPWG